MKFFALAALASCAAFVAAIPASPEDSALAARNFEVAAADTSAVSLDSEDFDLDVEAADDDDEVEGKLILSTALILLLIFASR